MRIVLTTFLAFFVALAMISCSDDSGVNIIDVGNGNGGDDNGNGGEEELGTVYSITFNVDGGGTFTFSVDMDGATIEGDDLPDDFDGDVYTFDPDNDKGVHRRWYGWMATARNTGKSATDQSRSFTRYYCGCRPGSV